MIANFIKRTSLGIFMIMIILALSSYSSAETTDNTESNSYHQVDSYVRYIPSCNVKAASGKVEFIESGNTYNYGFKAFGKLPVKLSLEAEYIGIEDTLNSVELPSHLMGLTTGLETTLPFLGFPETYLKLEINPSFYADDWDFPASSFRIPQHYFLIYRSNPKWTFLYGVAVYPDFENEVLPILGFIYKPNDKLVFNIIPRRPNVTYFINERISLFAQGR